MMAPVRRSDASASWSPWMQPVDAAAVSITVARRPKRRASMPACTARGMLAGRGGWVRSSPIAGLLLLAALAAALRAAAAAAAALRAAAASALRAAAAVRVV